MDDCFLEHMRDILLKDSVEKELKEFIYKISKLEFCENHNFRFEIKIINGNIGHCIDIIRTLNISEKLKNET